MGAEAPALDVKPESRSLLRGDVELVGFVATPFEGLGGSLGLGWRMLMGLGWGKIPLSVGFDFQSAYFGEATSRTNVGAWNYPLFVDKTRHDKAYFIDAYVRLQPPYWSVRPYIEAIAGAKLLQTDYSVAFVGGVGSTDTVSDHAWTYTAGGGTGVDLPVLGPSVYLTLGVRLLAGGHASYTRPVSPDSDVVVHYRTVTSTVLFALGLSGRFGKPPAAPASE